MNNDIKPIGSNPNGIKGMLAGIFMNYIHSNQYKSNLKKHLIDDKNVNNISFVLDIGCGGGKVINFFYSMLRKSIPALIRVFKCFSAIFFPNSS